MPRHRPVPQPACALPRPLPVVPREPPQQTAVPLRLLRRSPDHPQSPNPKRLLQSSARTIDSPKSSLDPDSARLLVSVVPGTTRRDDSTEELFAAHQTRLANPHDVRPDLASVPRP